MTLAIRILIGMVIGIIVGYFLQGSPEIATTYIAPIGTVFLNLIKMIIVPMVFSSLVVGVAGMEDVTKLGRIGAKTFIYFFITTAIAIVIGLVLGNILNVGGGFTLNTTGLAYEAKEAPPFIQTLINIIPSNPLNAIVSGEMLQIIVFALIFGVGLLIIGEKGQIVFQIFDSIAEAMYAITAGIMKLAPFGIFGLMAPVIAQNGPAVLLPLMKLIVVIYLASIIHIVFIYGASVKFLSKLNPIEFFKKAFPAWATAFTTSSSSGTLPVTMQSAENLDIPQPIYSFVLPLGATINMDGTAIYQGVCALFIAQVYGLNLDLGQQMTIVLTATLASVGTAGVPGAGMIMLAMVLQGVGLPVEGIALVAGVDRILDMIRTSLNVLGDLTCALFISRTESNIDSLKSKNIQDV
ncbi:MAG: dicarboxylate/amino acid:cation symporter [Tissierellia bacterium]|nr:dicarboxylate/amino acid:cation symporter [Tissierellia bacterium]